MLSELSEIKEIRKKLGLTQTELSRIANVSQSLIAKIEAGRIDPTYTNVRKIFSALNDLGQKNQVKAKDIMRTKIVSVSPHESMADTIKKMKKFGISQMPVLKDNHAVGLISESIILDCIGKDCKTIEGCMHDAPPTISDVATLDVIAGLLKFSPMVLVTKNGKIKGVITKSDVLERAYK